MIKNARSLIAIILCSADFTLAAPASPALTCQPSASNRIANPIQLANSDLAYYPIATGLTRPRHLLIDSATNVLVVDSGRGIVALTESNECAGYEQRLLVEDPDLNTGIALSADSTLLFASTTDNIYSWDYDPSTLQVTNQRTVVQSMAGGSHDTRTLVLGPIGSARPEFIITGRGSDGNLDLEAEANNRAQIRRFPLTEANTLTWTDGELLATGIRNAVGITLTPDGTKLYEIENSSDNLISVDGTDVHETNPAEEMNEIPLTSPSRFYGYPSCFTVFEGQAFAEERETGSQFSVDAAVAESRCQDTSIVTPPRLGLPAHYAPLDFKFHTATNTSFDSTWRNSAFITAHGSWNRQDPAGYSLVRVPFDESNWEPIAQADSNSGFETVFSAPDLSRCSPASGCFRPVGIAVERHREGNTNGMLISSDSTGEIIRLYKGQPITSHATKLVTIHTVQLAAVILFLVMAL